MRRVLHSALPALGLFLSACQGTTPVASQTAPIVGGEPAADPAVVVVSGSDGTFCTGTVIAERVVLTAKHCVQPPSADAPRPPETFVVGIGDTFAGLTRIVDVTAIHAPPGAYAPGGPSGIGLGIEGQDVAALVLSGTTSVTPIPVRAAAPTDLVGASVRAVGFGRTPGGDSGTKHRVTIAIVDVRDTTIETGAATCRGDSGGPLLGPDGDVIGVSSFQLGTCGTGSAHFNRVDIHADVVARAVAQAGSCTPTGSEVCDAIDNDCNGMVDETCQPLGAPCLDSAECERLGVCIETVAGTICTIPCDPRRPTFGCGPGLYCELDFGCRGLCVPGLPGPGRSGDPCAEAIDCESLVCVDPGDGRRRCAEPCEGDTGTCPGGTLCAALPTGCGGCVADGWSGRHGLGEPCDEDDDCHSQECFDDAGVRYCTRFCDGDDACGLGGFHCRSGTCVRGEREGPGGTCAFAEDCRDGLTCERLGGVGFCTNGCSGDADCPEGFGCGSTDGGTACVPDLALLGEPCSDPMQCISGLCAETSDGSVCTQRCGLDAPCPPDFACILPDDGTAAVCVRPPPSPPVDEGGCATVPGRHGTTGWWLALLAIGFARRKR